MEKSLKNGVNKLKENASFLLAISHSSDPGSYEDFLEGLKVFDKDGNGIMNSAELRHVLTTLGEKLTGSQFDDLIDGMESSNRQIVIEDFIKKVMCDDEAGTLGNIDFEDVIVGFDTWNEKKESYGLPLDQLPVLVVDGITLCQTTAIERFAATKENKDRRAAAMRENYKKMMNEKCQAFDKILKMIQTNKDFCIGNELTFVDIQLVSLYIFSKDVNVGHDFEKA
ncbi:unnamed protein product [Oikopleura dioica]|uniref:EF-hand domain-containing protein n=1 Tax=Oikopleura dioica TaxID=34765 RepID=E4YBI7_OIKDI|nr:unnamed protein product [Oikopleura dioica]